MGITLSMMRSLMGIVVGKGTFPWTNIRVQPGEVTMVLHMGLELWDREEENPEVLDLLEVFLGIFPRKDIRVEKLEGELRAGVQNDDITECLARKGAVDQGKIFEEEMRKHDKTVQLIRQNIQAQSNIVRAMTERNAVYADARIKVDEVMR